MISTYGVKVYRWGMNNNTRGRERMPLNSGVLGWKTISNAGFSSREIKELDSKSVNPVPNVSESKKLQELKVLHHSFPEAYKPKLVSIGPYHLGKDKQDAMKEIKQQYLNSLLDRIKEKSKDSYIVELKKLEVSARGCYVDLIDPKIISSEAFVEMMLLDGCFIIEFFRKSYLKHVVGGINEGIDDDPIFNDNLKECQIRRDMMLLGNQLPYDVLAKLYDMTKDPKEGPIMEIMATVGCHWPAPGNNVMMAKLRKMPAANYCFHT